MDKLKQYLRENREGMDMDQPTEPVWENIQAASPVIKRSSPVVLFYRYAAVFTGLVVLVTGIRVLQQDTVIQNAAVFSFNTTVLPERRKPRETVLPVELPGKENDPVKTVLAKNNKEVRIDPYELLGSFSNSYSQLVKLQLKNIRTTPVWVEDPDYFNEFRSTLEQMDADEATLRGIIKRNGLNEHLLEQVINIYQQKLDLLKTLKSEINKVNKTVKPGSTDSLKSYFINI